MEDLNEENDAFGCAALLSSTGFEVYQIVSVGQGPAYPGDQIRRICLGIRYRGPRSAYLMGVADIDGFGYYLELSRLSAWEDTPVEYYYVTKAGPYPRP